MNDVKFPAYEKKTPRKKFSLIFLNIILYLLRWIEQDLTHLIQEMYYVPITTTHAVFYIFKSQTFLIIQSSLLLAALCVALFNEVQTRREKEMRA